MIIEHLLMLQYGPSQGPRNAWRASVRAPAPIAARSHARLRQILDAELRANYGEVCDDTAALLRDDGEDAAADALPATCPGTLDQVAGDWWP